MIQTLLKRFSRITSGARLIPEVEGLRFVAVLSIFLYHLGDELLRKKSEQLVRAAVDVPGTFDGTVLAVLSHLGVGVYLFFAISGFILALRFAQHSLADGPAVSLKSYFLRRLTRLEPPYIIALVLSVPLAILIHHVERHPWSLLPHFLASMTYTHGLFYKSWSDINGVTWSLEVEVQFYLLAPLFALVYKVRSSWVRYLVYLVATVSVFLWQHFHTDPNWALFLPSYLQYFIVGFFLADVYVTRWNCRPPVGWQGDLVSAAGWTALTALLLAGGPWNFLVPAAIAVAYLGALTGTWSKRLLSVPLIVTIGGMCYTIYLYHASIIIVATRLTFLAVFGHSFLLNLIVQAVLSGVIVLAFSFPLFALFERPFMDKRWPQEAMSFLRSRFGKHPAVSATQEK